MTCRSWWGPSRASAKVYSLGMRAVPVMRIRPGGNGLPIAAIPIDACPHQTTAGCQGSVHQGRLLRKAVAALNLLPCHFTPGVSGFRAPKYSSPHLPCVPKDPDSGIQNGALSVFSAKQLETGPVGAPMWARAGGARGAISIGSSTTKLKERRCAIAKSVSGLPPVVMFHRPRRSFERIFDELARLRASLAGRPFFQLPTNASLLIPRRAQPMRRS